MIRTLHFLGWLLPALLAVQTGWGQSEFSLKAGIEVPRGELKWVYGPAPGYSLSFARLTESRGGSTALGTVLGYVRLRPRQETFYYLLNAEEYGRARYSDYHILQFNGQVQRNHELGKQLALYWGADFGYYYVTYRYSDHNPYAQTDGSVIEGRGALSPKAGLTLMLGEKWGLLCQSKYTGYFSLGSTDAGSADYNPSVGAVHFLWSNQLGFFVRL